jgi:hypothetical protein
MADSIAMADSFFNLQAMQAAKDSLNIADALAKSQATTQNAMDSKPENKDIEKPPPDQYNEPEYSIPEKANSAEFFLGRKYGGGIIFYIDGTGKHGLIASTWDQSTGVSWGCSGIQINGTYSSVGSGQSNTRAIVYKCRQISGAASLCDELTINGMSDWFLPSKGELEIMYQQKDVIGGFSNGLYWSSTSQSNNMAYLQSFSNGYKDSSFKSASFCVRAIRAF